MLPKLSDWLILWTFFSERQPREDAASSRDVDTTRNEQESADSQLRRRDVPGTGGGGADDRGGGGEVMVTVKLVSLASTKSVRSSVTASMADLRRWVKLTVVCIIIV